MHARACSHPAAGMAFIVMLAVVACSEAKKKPRVAPLPNDAGAANGEVCLTPVGIVGDAASSVSVPAGRRSDRACCRFGAGAMPDDTLDEHAPTGNAIPIDHFVVIMQENRSFDHYFQKLPEFGQPDADVAPPEYGNPDPANGDKPVHPFHASSLCTLDVEHGWNDMHRQYADGKMDGFMAVGNPNGSRALAYYDEHDLPYYYALASTFALSDRYFTELLGPTYPNRAFALAGTSLGMVINGIPPIRIEKQSLFTSLHEADVSWSVYCDAGIWEDDLFPNLRSHYPDNFGTIHGLLDDAANGALPSVAWVEANRFLGGAGDNEHPPADIQLGQAFVAKLIDALMHSPQWSSTAIFLLYDEGGSFYDHVPPPKACVPDEIEPVLKSTDVQARFDRLGFRVPFVVVSPYAKPHYVSHEVLSHASILRMVQARFSLPALSARDANANAPYDLFDFAHAAFLTPPQLPAATIDEKQRTYCQTTFPTYVAPASDMP